MTIRSRNNDDEALFLIAKHTLTETHTHINAHTHAHTQTGTNTNKL